MSSSGCRVQSGGLPARVLDRDRGVGSVVDSGSWIMRSSSVVRAAVAGSVLALLPSVAQAATRQPTVVAASAVVYTPQLVASDAVARPRVDALSVAGARTYAGGVFDRVSEGGRTHTGFGNMMAFSTSSGAVDTGFKPRFNAPVKAVEADPSGGVFVGGAFTTVNGATRAGLVKLTATGRIDTSFKPYFGSGQVNDLELATIKGQRRLIVAGNISGKLASVNPATGANTGELDAVFSNAIPGARGGVAVFQVSVSPDDRRLIATGNFRTVTVDGRGSARRAFVMLDLPTTTSQTRVDPWYYPGFGKECSATDSDDARRIANLQGVDWAPTKPGEPPAFNVTATGKIPRDGDVWHAWDTDANNAGSSVCDAVGRFSLSNDNQAVWINYSGGDSIWTVQDTGAAVYVQGHMKYMGTPTASPRGASVTPRPMSRPRPARAWRPSAPPPARP